MVKTTTTPRQAAGAAIGILEDILGRSDQEMAAVHAAIDRDRERLAEAISVTDPNLANVRIGPPPDRETVLRARAERPDLERRLAENELRAIGIDAANAQALSDLRAARLAEVLPQQREAIDGATQALLTAREAIDRLIELEDQEEAIRGCSIERLTAPWCALASARSSVFRPGLDEWLERVEELRS